MNYSRIRAARKNAGITQEQLAKMIGINRATLSRYESGDIDPPSSQLGRIADVLNVPIGELYDFSIEAEQNRTVDEIKEIKTQLKETVGKEQEELEDALSILEESYDDICFASMLQPHMSPLESLTDEESALKILLNCMGYDIMKARGNYYFTHNHGGSVISKDDLNELLSCAQNGLKIAAKTLELKLLREAFGSNSPKEIIFPPPPTPIPHETEGKDTPPPSDAAEGPSEGE
jgi:transcriptional regulator with XRE-family HTH domain